MVPSDLEADRAAYSLSLWLGRGSGDSMADVQVVHLVFAILG